MVILLRIKDALLTKEGGDLPAMVPTMMPMIEASRARWTDQYRLVSIAVGVDDGTKERAPPAPPAPLVGAFEVRRGLYVKNVEAIEP